MKSKKQDSDQKLVVREQKTPEEKQFDEYQRQLELEIENH
jgi:hypothetical protein